MFIYENGVFKSSLLMEKQIPHGFSTRNGGVSVLPHTASMNVGFGRGDEDDVVYKNIKLLEALSGIENAKTAFSPQIHSKIVRKIENNEFSSPLEECDGFITDLKGVSLLVRMADCVPILFYGGGVISAVHAGWRGTVSGICEEAVLRFSEYGVLPNEITVAIGHCIHSCCFEVKEDFVEAVAKERGSDFAFRHIQKRKDEIFADIVGMNEEILKNSGVVSIDSSPRCTACDSALFHSHRKTNGVRGTMGAVIALG
jgi:YfiH family protein